MVPDRGVGKNSVIFKGMATGSLSMLQWVDRQHKLYLIYNISGGGEGHTSGRVDLGGMGLECDWGTLNETPK